MTQLNAARAASLPFNLKQVLLASLATAVVLGFIALTAWKITQKIYAGGYAAGEVSVQTKWDAERLALLAEAATYKAERNAAQSDLTTALVEREGYKKELKNVEEDFNVRLAAVAAGAKRVYIKGSCPAPNGVTTYGNTPAGTTPPAPRNAGHGCELDPATVADLAGIARDGDRAIIERNEMIARYNLARQKLLEFNKNINGKPP